MKSFANEMFESVRYAKSTDDIIEKDKEQRLEASSLRLSFLPYSVLLLG